MIPISRLSDLADGGTALCERPSTFDDGTLAAVADIETAVIARGDAALREYSARWDAPVDALRVPAEALRAAWDAADPALRDAIEAAAGAIRAFHEGQRPPDQPETETWDGVTCWRRWQPVARAGIYVPGGTAPLVSSLLMGVIPAQVAGVERIVVCTPPPAAPAILAAAHALGVGEVVAVGGAQAVFALAHGTESVPRVDLIAGPGNAYVAAAKLRAGRVCRVDGVAGPSELLVLADGTVPAGFVAADLLSQAEHGLDSHVVVVTTSDDAAREVVEAVEAQVGSLPRADVARRALAHAAAVVADTLDDAVDFANRYAAEHLVLAVEDWQPVAARIRNAGSVFCGPWAPESAGDYASGTNHTLPTGGFARSSGGVDVGTFGRHISFQTLSADGLRALAPTVTTLARAERLEAHARAVDVRLDALAR